MTQSEMKEIGILIGTMDGIKGKLEEMHKELKGFVKNGTTKCLENESAIKLVKVDVEGIKQKNKSQDKRMYVAFAAIVIIAQAAGVHIPTLIGKLMGS